MEDPAEIASLAQEFISSLDNLPQEVGHLMSEIQHKEDKIADLLPRIANREAQVRDIITKGGANLINPGASVPESDRAKLEKLHDRIKTDFDRVGELSRQKEDLAIQLWRDVFTHHARLKAEMEKIAPHVLESFTANDVQHPLPTFAQTLPTLTALKSGADPDAMFKRKISGLSATLADRAASGSGTPKDWRHGTPTGDTPSHGGIGRGTPPSSASAAMRGGRKSLRGSGRGGASSSLSHGGGRTSMSMAMADELDADGEMDLDLPTGLEEPLADDKDATLYCHCQRVSFGEMIGCDGEDCKFEWFHIGCVGVSKPLPDSWYCDDCKAKLAASQAAGGNKKRKNR